MSFQQCDGNGECLEQTDDPNTYGKRADFNCAHNCQPIPCCNEIICGSWFPPWFHGLKKVGICICFNCNMTFGKKLDIVENVECPMCLETTKCVIQPNCTHPTCVPCFKRCHYGEYEPQPQFPYPEEVYDEFENHQLDGHDPAEFIARYPLIEKWDKDWKKWDQERDAKYAREQNLRICPICRR